MAYISNKKPKHFTFKFRTFKNLRNFSIIVIIICFVVAIGSLIIDKNRE